MDHMQKTLDATQEAIDNIPEQQEGFFGAVGRGVAAVATLGMSEVFRKK
jgi:hypothetical protein